MDLWKDRETGLFKTLNRRAHLSPAFLFMLVGTFCASDLQAQALTVAISNVDPRVDENGNILDAHDGSLERFSGRFYLYGTRYGNTGGLGKSNAYVCYSSDDLTHWRYEGPLLRDAPQRVYYRPYVKFNPATRKYVLWFNADNHYGVATADRPEGPFTIHDPNVRLKYSQQGVGDFGLFVDQNGSAYIAYTALNLPGMKLGFTPHPKHHRISVELLTSDYLGSTRHNGGFVAANVESPSVFNRNGVYYLLFDNTCAFCKSGSGVRVYTSVSPLGPYAYRNNINVYDDLAGRPPIWTEPGTGRDNTILHAQQTHVAQFETLSGMLYMWMGDCWGSNKDGVKGHDFQIWVPLEFTEEGMIRPLKNLERWTVQISTTSGEKSDSGRELFVAVSRRGE